MTAQTSFEIEQWVHAPPREVFEHFTVADKLVRWHGVQARIEARPGGLWWCKHEDGSVIRGEILELEPPRRLVFTWGFEAGAPTAGLASATPAGASRIEVWFDAVDDGTRVRLRHTGFVRGDSVSTGWRHFVGVLEALFKS